ncbi:response regulator transcription factor [Paenibacillus aquistagni]|uniref:Two-component system, OmpR family, response regulator CssR n=1 Tax=Paenibacillus aquistagni TaxID=1852522 RepID=A0A1X7LV02_9BACL|nr:response regulator transcription factor [Paenibacillus aquistagni]SMG57510.1 two-component system, OmpR family, response regulator CssR [Paenibacillus aquistagni]
MHTYRIAVVDDDQHIRQLVETYLQKENMATIGLGSAEEAWELWRTHPPDMWVLDVMLPGMDGFEFCKKIRSDAEVPIIMISARDDEVDKILGIELGSDDYLVKPFSPRELVARVKRQLQRMKKLQSKDEPLPIDAADDYIDLGELRLLLHERRAIWRKNEVDLTSKEFDLLKLFVERPNRAFARDEILQLVWGEDYFGSDRAVDHLVKRLRKKMGDLPVEAVWGHGYRLNGGEC